MVDQRESCIQEGRSARKYRLDKPWHVAESDQIMSRWHKKPHGADYEVCPAFVRGHPGETRVRAYLLGLLAASFWCVLIPGGCAPTLKPIFAEPTRPIVWPPPPASPRIQYVGELREAADLKPPVGFVRRLGRIFAGQEPAQPLFGPRAAVCTRDGQRLWVADPGGRCLHLFDLTRRAYRKITRLGDTPLLSPVGLCLGDEDSIYLCDSERGSVFRLCGRSGALLDSLRMPDEVDRPVAVAYRRESAELFVVDVLGHDIKVLARDGELLRIIGQRGTRPGEFNFPCAIASDAELLWVADAANHRVQGLTYDGQPVRVFGRAGDAPGNMALPKGITVDRDGHLYVVDARFENVQVFDREGRLLLVFGEEGTKPGAFWLPSGIAADAADRLWVCDSYNRRVQVFRYLRTDDGAP